MTGRGISPNTFVAVQPLKSGPKAAAREVSYGVIFRHRRTQPRGLLYPQQMPGIEGSTSVKPEADIEPDLRLALATLRFCGLRSMQALNP